MSKISELSDGGSLVSTDYLIAVRSGGNVKVRMDEINVDQVDLGDNEFIRLGNSQDLTLVHNASNSIINQAGIGDLLIQKAGSTKLTVNSTGVDVTGTVTADGLTVDGGTLYHKVVSTFPSTYTTNLQIGQQGNINNDASADEFLFNHTGTNAATNTLFKINSKNVLNIQSGGDISFYEDTGTTAKLFWDADDEALRVGSTSAIFTNSVISGVSALGPTIGGKQTTAAQSAGGFWNSDTGTVNLLNFYAGSAGTQVGSIKGSSTGVSLLGTGGEGLTVYGNEGNVGIGTTASNKLDIKGTVGFEATNSTNKWLAYHYTDNTLRFNYNGAGADELVIDSSGNVGIGITPTNPLSVYSASGSANINLTRTGTSESLQIGTYFINANGNDLGLATLASHPMTFKTNNVERMRITNTGYTKMSPTGTYVSSASSYHEMYQNYTGITSYIYNYSATGDGLLLNVNNENTTNFFLAGYSDSALRYNIYIYSNGDLLNRNNSYGGFSDQKLKQDIEDASRQWDDIKAIKFRKYRWKDDVAADANAPYQLGVIAQELEAAGMSGLVEETADKEFYDEVVLDSDGNPVVDEDGNNVTEQKERLTGESTKSVKYSILTMKALVALQEAMTRIESLEARIAALES